MLASYQRRNKCRQCGSKDLSLAIKLSPTPLANAYKKKNSKESYEKLYPLDVFFCNQCKHVQLLDVINPKILFENYVYVSGTSPVFVKHFSDYADFLYKKYCNKGLVIDIGSNDGTLLKCFKNYGFSTLGIEPAEKIAKEAISNGIETIIDFFKPDLAESIKNKYGSAKIITANNVFAHIDDPITFLQGIKLLLCEERGIFVFEVSYLKDVIENTYFDTIYHEHLDYHTLLPLKGLLERSGFEVINAVCVNSHGGSIRVISKLKGCKKYTIDKSVDSLIENEKKLGLHAFETYQDFSKKINDAGKNLRNLLLKLKSEGKTIIGYGAPAKATTLMHHFDIGSELIEFIVDDSEWKHFLYTPGKNIQIVPKDFIETKKPDYILILAWNFASSIIKNNIYFKEKGGKFIIPLPNTKIV